MGSPLQGFVRTERQPAVPGEIADVSPRTVLTYINDDPRAAQSDTITVATATNDKDYVVTINGIDITFTSDSTATVAEVADGLAAAIEAEPLVNGTVDAVSDGVDTVTLTAKVAGVGYTLSEDDAELSTASVAANAEAAAIPFGRCVITNGLSATNNKLAKAVNDTDVTDTADLDSLAAGVTVRDETRELEVGSDTAEYPGGSAMGVLRKGQVYVKSEAALSDPSDGVFVRNAADGDLDELGGFSTATGTGLVQWSNARWVRQTEDTSGGTIILVLQVDA